jgi:hypothetical protein
MWRGCKSKMYCGACGLLTMMRAASDPQLLFFILLYQLLEVNNMKIPFLGRRLLTTQLSAGSLFSLLLLSNFMWKCCILYSIAELAVCCQFSRPQATPNYFIFYLVPIIMQLTMEIWLFNCSQYYFFRNSMYI